MERDEEGSGSRDSLELHSIPTSDSLENLMVYSNFVPGFSKMNYYSVSKKEEVNGNTHNNWFRTGLERTIKPVYWYTTITKRWKQKRQMKVSYENTVPFLNHL